jgi:hypothetical protein
LHSNPHAAAAADELEQPVVEAAKIMNGQGAAVTKDSPNPETETHNFPFRKKHAQNTPKRNLHNLKLKTHRIKKCMRSVNLPLGAAG